MLSCPIVFGTNNTRQDAADYINVLNSRVMDGSRRQEQVKGDIEYELTQRKREFKFQVENTIVDDPLYDPDDNFRGYDND